MFADVRGSTSLAESMDATAFAALLNRFYKAARGVLVGRHAIIDKMIGDEVMAFFVPASGPQYHRIAMQAGTAYVGKIGGDGVHTSRC